MDTDRFSDDDLMVSRSDILDLLHSVRDELKQMIDESRQQTSLSIETEVDSHVDKLIDSKIKELTRTLKDEINEVKSSFTGFISSMERMIRALPRPEITVNVPELKQPTISVEAPHVEIKPADVTVNVPKQDQPTIQVAAPEVTVNVPKQDQPIINVSTETPIINVNVPQQESPEIIVNVPKQDQPKIEVNVPTRKVTKHISYDEYGRPVTIEEES